MGRRTLIFIIVLLLITLGAVVYIRNPRPFKVAWASAVFGNREHFLDCRELPFYPQVKKAVSEHEDMVEKIKNIEGVKDIKPELNKCHTLDNSGYFSKGDIVIDYTSRKTRKEIEKLIGNNFFGIPYRGHKQ